MTIIIAPYPNRFMARVNWVFEIGCLCEQMYSELEEKGQQMRVIALAAFAVAALLFSGCSASNVLNTGGDTKCKDFTTQDEKKQNDEVTKMLKDRIGTDPQSLQISTTRAGVLTWCQTLGTPESKISEAPHL